DPAPDVVDHRHGGGLGDLRDRQGGGLELLRPEPVTRDVDDVVDAAEDAEIPVGGLQGSVTGKVGPVVPVLAVSVPVVLGVVDVDEALWLPPDRLHDPWPRIPDADVARAAAARWDLVAVLVVDDGVDAEGARA